MSVTRSNDFFKINLGSNQIDSDNKLRADKCNSCTTPKCSKPDYEDVHKNHNHLHNNLPH
jgi:hypothetical protein